MQIYVFLIFAFEEEISNTNLSLSRKRVFKRDYVFAQERRLDYTKCHAPSYSQHEKARNCEEWNLTTIRSRVSG